MTRPARDLLAWAALAAALAVTASAEYSLARACGFGAGVAAGVPAALDIYAIRALRARRDVLAVVVAMIGVNAASHLVTAGLLPVSVPLVVAVSAIAPLVLWRVHALGHARASTPEPQVDTPAPQVDTPAVPPVSTPGPERPALEAAEQAREVDTLASTPAPQAAIPPMQEVSDTPGDTREPEGDTRLSTADARRVIEDSWRRGLSVREAARLSTRSRSYAGRVYRALEDRYGPQPSPGQTTLDAA